MPTINDIRTYMTSWKQHTYRQGLDYCYAVKKDKVAYELTIEVLQRQGLEQKHMDGNSVQSIPIKNEGKVDIIYTNLFWQLAEGFISPANYVGTIVSKCVEQGITQNMAVAGIVGRGLRAFPSFLREMDLTYKLSKYFPDAEIKNGPEQDVGDHTDILIEACNQTYRVWSYQNFERGLVNTASRVRGNRGEVPKGMHVLCPIDIGNDIEKEMVDGWYFYSDRYVKYLYDMIQMEKPDEYSELSRLNEYALKMYLKKPNIFRK